jgi:hypothetical protein
MLAANLPLIQSEAVTGVTLFGSLNGDNYVARNKNSFYKGWT